MLAWVSSFWTDSLATGPARNAPNNGVNIKSFFDQRPQQVITLTAEEVQAKLKSLKPTIINERPPISNKPPLMQEFDDVFGGGYKGFLEAQRNKRSEKVKQQIAMIEQYEDELYEDELDESDESDYSGYRSECDVCNSKYCTDFDCIYGHNEYDVYEEEEDIISVEELKKTPIVVNSGIPPIPEIPDLSKYHAIRLSHPPHDSIFAPRMASSDDEDLDLITEEEYHLRYSSGYTSA